MHLNAFVGICMSNKLMAQKQHLSSKMSSFQKTGAFVCGPYETGYFLWTTSKVVPHLHLKAEASEQFSLKIDPELPIAFSAFSMVAPRMMNIKIFIFRLL